MALNGPAASSSILQNWRNIKSIKEDFEKNLTPAQKKIFNKEAIEEEDLEKKGAKDVNQPASEEKGDTKKAGDNEEDGDTDSEMDDYEDMSDLNEDNDMNIAEHRMEDYKTMMYRTMQYIADEIRAISQEIQRVKEPHGVVLPANVQEHVNKLSARESELNELYHFTKNAYDTYDERDPEYTKKIWLALGRAFFDSEDVAHAKIAEKGGSLNEDGYYTIKVGDQTLRIGETQKIAKSMEERAVVRKKSHVTRRLQERPEITGVNFVRAVKSVSTVSDILNPETPTAREAIQGSQAVRSAFFINATGQAGRVRSPNQGRPVIEFLDHSDVRFAIVSVLKYATVIKQTQRLQVPSEKWYLVMRDCTEMTASLKERAVDMRTEEHNVDFIARNYRKALSSPGLPDWLLALLIQGSANQEPTELTMAKNILLQQERLTTLNLWLNWTDMVSVGKQVSPEISSLGFPIFDEVPISLEAEQANYLKALRERKLKASGAVKSKKKPGNKGASKQAVEASAEEGEAPMEEEEDPGKKGKKTVPNPNAQNLKLPFTYAQSIFHDHGSDGGFPMRFLTVLPIPENILPARLFPGMSNEDIAGIPLFTLPDPNLLLTRYTREDTVEKAVRHLSAAGLNKDHLVQMIYPNVRDIILLLSSQAFNIMVKGREDSGYKIDNKMRQYNHLLYQLDLPIGYPGLTFSAPQHKGMAVGVTYVPSMRSSNHLLSFKSWGYNDCSVGLYLFALAWSEYKRFLITSESTDLHTDLLNVIVYLSKCFVNGLNACSRYCSPVPAQDIQYDRGVFCRVFGRSPEQLLSSTGSIPVADADGSGPKTAPSMEMRKSPYVIVLTEEEFSMSTESLRNLALFEDKFLDDPDVQLDPYRELGIMALGQGDQQPQVNPVAS